MKSVRLAMATFLVTVLWVGQAFSQASAETVLTHGVGSGAASTPAKMLGNALGNAAGQMGSRLGQQTSIVPRRQRVPVAPTTTSGAAPVVRTAPTAAAPPFSGSLITSIQGGVSLVDSTSGGCTPGSNGASTASAKTDASGRPSTEKVPPPLSACVLARELSSHPAVVNLPPAH